MVSYENIQKRYDPTKGPDVNALFGRALLKRAKQQKMKIVNTEEIVEKIANKRLAEHIALYQIQHPTSIFSIVVFREFLTDKFVGYRTTLISERDKLIKEMSMLPFPYEKLTKAYLPFGKGKQIEIVFCTVHKPNANDLIDYLATSIFIINKTATFSEKDGDAYGTMLADLIPALQEIEKEPDLVP